MSWNMSDSHRPRTMSLSASNPLAVRDSPDIVPEDSGICTLSFDSWSLSDFRALSVASKEFRNTAMKSCQVWSRDDGKAEIRTFRQEEVERDVYERVGRRCILADQSVACLRTEGVWSCSRRLVLPTNTN